jgi:ribonuclease HI
VKKVEIYSDGGGERGSSAAGACIIDSGEGKRERYVAALGGATNNESEIFSGLLGLAIVARRLGGAEIDWFSDSEYTLKSATSYIVNWQRNGWRTANRQAVKNQGLWRAYLSITHGMKIHPHHVRGHSGHPENEECDQISTEIQNLQLNGERLPLTVTARDGNTWRLVDAREALDALRPTEPDLDRFERWLESVVCS